MAADKPEDDQKRKKWRPTLSSVVEGITIGIVIALLLGAYQTVSSWRDEVEQIDYINQQISRAHEQMKNAHEISENNPQMTTEQLLCAYFAHLFDRMKLSLDFELEDLDLTNKLELRILLADSEDVMRRIPALGAPYTEGSEWKDCPRNVPYDIEIYEDVFFDKINSMTWLK